MRFPPRLGEPSRRNRVLEARPNRFGVGVGELDADDGAQRYGGEVGWRGVRPFGVPHVDDEAAGVAVGVLDEFSPSCTVLMLDQGERGELGDPACSAADPA